MMTKGDQGEMDILSSYPQTNNGFFFLPLNTTFFVFKKRLLEVSEHAEWVTGSISNYYNMMASL